MAIQLWDLAGQEEERRFSPYCWRAKLSLWHKGLDFTTIPWRFTETERLAFSGQGAVPVLQDGDKVVANSWDIATYLEDTYPDRPSLFAGASGRAVSAFVSDWAENTFNPALGPMLGIDVWRASHEKDKAYYRKSREARVGHTLEQGAENRETKILAGSKSGAGAAARDALGPGVHRWRDAALRRLRRLRHLPVGALRERVRVVGARRSNRCLARPRARSLRRPAAKEPRLRLSLEQHARDTFRIVDVHPVAGVRQLGDANSLRLRGGECLELRALGGVEDRGAPAEHHVEDHASGRPLEHFPENRCGSSPAATRGRRRDRA